MFVPYFEVSFFSLFPPPSLSSTFLTKSGFSCVLFDSLAEGQ